MPFFIPVAVGGLVLTALGLGVKRVLEEVAPASPEEARVREARERHAEALAALRAARLLVREGLVAWGARQSCVHTEVALPFRELLERLERWGHARADEVLDAGALEALRALPPAPSARADRRPWPLLGVGAVPPPELLPVLAWLDRGWLDEDAPPVVVDGASLFEAAAPRDSQAPGTPDARVRALDEAAGVLAQATRFLEELRARLVAREARVAALHGRASVQLTYLDASSFEEDGPEPRERLLRLAALVGRLGVLLRAPVLGVDGRLAPAPPESPDDEAAPHT
ncbi:serine/threonine-protein kinase [Pyxidicoccus xibeiensis]|uniref:hypothetical protein n=1 Tax=Pyxidicoccus xibeiensis TaxID=2906759 RepID=UPI0020A835C6|nr:hypothetical protein [Pyxidicoccus xibeiensis]MCP3139892.1 hypothetical protein [Pyxidicoccus xibeiensis]